MNHTQFLCYGALKIFLKEVLCSKNKESLFCSYYLKTFFSGRFKITRTAQFGVRRIYCLVSGCVLNACLSVLWI